MASLVLDLISFDPIDNYLIDCGSSSNTTVGARVFVADSSTSKFLSTPTNIIVTSSANNSMFVPYQTARIFPPNSNSSYTFPIIQTGRHWIRFYFLPFAHGNYNMSLANFSVSTQSHRLLSNFNPKGASMKEFSIYLSSSTLVITFIPSNNSFAFLNALEVVSVPEFLITDNASTVSTQPRKFDHLSTQAFETIARELFPLGVLSYDESSSIEWHKNVRYITWGVAAHYLA
ncbi:hypothetical protein LguiA_021046 [Lonicera macranthoides]